MRVNTIRLRAMIGWLGMLLPWIVVALTKGFPKSISATWYTNACTPFMIILGAASILLICYKGYTVVDDVLLTCSGIAGLLICLFPCYVQGASKEVGTFLIDIYKSHTIHCAAAFVFFGLLAFNSLFLFTKSSGEKTRNKKIRNAIYIMCGVGMLASFLILLAPPFYIRTWLMETIALFFFAVSFLTKANIYPWLFADKQKNEEVIIHVPSQNISCSETGLLLTRLFEKLVAEVDELETVESNKSEEKQ